MCEIAASLRAPFCMVVSRKKKEEVKREGKKRRFEKEEGASETGAKAIWE